VVGRSSWYRGRANPRKWEETGTGAETNERSAARRLSPLPFNKEEAWQVQEKEGGQGLRPCEDRKSSGLVARTSIVTLQKSSGDAWSRISSANALQKERQGRVNGGLARSEGWR